MVRLDLRVRLAHKVHLAHRALPDQRDRKAHKVPQAAKAPTRCKWQRSVGIAPMKQAMK